MSLFNFFKRKPNLQPQSFDELFAFASKDVAYRPLFYETLLEMELYVLISPDENLPKGKFVADKNLTLKVQMLSGGTIPIFSSENKIYENNVIKEQVHYVALKGQSFFDMFPIPPVMLLNPYSTICKELLPEEIIQVRNGQVYNNSGTKQEIKAGTRIQISFSEDHSEILVSTLKTYAGTRKEIKEVYLALLNNLESEEKPHLVIGVRAGKNTKQIFKEMGETIKPYIPENGFIDMIDLSKSNTTAKVLRDKQFRIF